MDIILRPGLLWQKFLKSSIIVFLIHLTISFSFPLLTGETQSRTSQLSYCFCLSICIARMREKESPRMPCHKCPACLHVLVAVVLFLETLSHAPHPDCSQVLGNLPPSAFKCGDYRCEPLFPAPVCVFIQIIQFQVIFCLMLYTKHCLPHCSACHTDVHGTPSGSYLLWVRVLLYFLFKN